MPKKLSLLDLQKKKLNEELATWITAYDFPLASVAESAGIDMILVGDSGGMVQLGYHTTNPVTMDEMIGMAKAVRRGAPNTFIIGDMPQGSYEISNETAIYNALRFVKEAGCDAIKLEGGVRICPRVRAIVDAGILVFGHLGLTPQSTASFGGYKVQGKTIDGLRQLTQDAYALQDHGACVILLEAMPSESAGQITLRMKIPVYGIGAGNLVDGQLIIMHDLLGFYQTFRPWFAKCYIPEVIHVFATYLEQLSDVKKTGREDRKDGLLVLSEMAIAEYIKQVKEKSFPTDEYNYPIKDEDLAILKASTYWIHNTDKGYE